MHGDLFEPSPGHPVQLEMGHDLAAEHAQRLLLVGRERARLAVEHAQRADGVPVRRAQGHARVEADPGLTGHPGIVGEARITRRIGDDHQLAGLAQGMGAKRHRPRRLGQREAVVGHEPLPVAVDERYEGDRRAADPCRERGQLVKRGLGGRVQGAIALKRAHAFGFVGGPLGDDIGG